MSTLQTCTSGSRPSHGAGVIAYETDTTRTIISDGSNWHLYMPDLFSRATCAFSLRQIVPDYTGSCVRVRRSSDNGELDIGFTDTGVLDQAALLSHTGTGGSATGYVVTWYDQGPSGMNGTQSTASQQPTIVSAGAVTVSNSKPSIQFGGGFWLKMPIRVTYTPDTQCWNNKTGSPTAGLAVCELTVGSGTQDDMLWGTGANGSGYSHYYGDNIGAYGTSGNIYFRRTQSTATGIQLDSSAALVNNTQSIAWWNYDGTTTAISSDGGSEQTTTTAPNVYIGYTQQCIGSSNGSGYDSWEGKISELVFYQVGRASQKAAILANVNTFYGTY